jgi:hypothetical protein
VLGRVSKGTRNTHENTKMTRVDILIAWVTSKESNEFRRECNENVMMKVLRLWRWTTTLVY